MSAFPGGSYRAIGVGRLLMSSSQESQSAPPPEHVAQMAEHLFRHESAKLVATLTRIFGVQHLNLAEDVVQEALAKALQTWPYYGIPDNPSAWLTQVSKRLALDVIRREKVFRDKELAIIATFDRDPSTATTQEAAAFDEEIKDDHLRMLFVCCHPTLPQEAQVALALKTLCGFSTIEISKAFLTTESNIAKRLTRAKQKLRDEGIQFEIPHGDDLLGRLKSVWQTLYLLFNEGYKASTGEKLIREELCSEAIRLTSFLADHPRTNTSSTHALLAIMLFNAARLPARVGADGELVLLEMQDRSKWDFAMIARGLWHLKQSIGSEHLGSYQLQAGILACHCTAPDYPSTEWPQILALYDQLQKMDPSPIVTLNRAVAVSKVHGPEAGLKALASIRSDATLQNYHLLHAVLGELESQLGNHSTATDHYQRALKLAETAAEKRFLLEKIGALRAKHPTSNVQ